MASASLPLETICHIARQCVDLDKPDPVAWLNVRHVSKLFRYEVERVFVESILPQTIVFCYTKDFWSCSQKCPAVLHGTKFMYESSDPLDSRIATFKCEERSPEPCHPGLQMQPVTFERSVRVRSPS